MILLQSTTTRSNIVTIVSLYFILVGLATIYNGFNLFVGGAVSIAVTGVPLFDEGEVNAPAAPGSDQMLLLTLFGGLLLAAGAVMIVNAVALFARKQESRRNSVLVAALTIIVVLLSLAAGLGLQWIPLVISPLVIYLFALNRPMKRYFDRRLR